jgi:hypothetical protein
VERLDPVRYHSPIEGRSTLSSAELYRKHAVDCFAMAQGAVDGRNKAVLLDMAQYWLNLADQAAKNELTDIVYETPQHRS